MKKLELLKKINQLEGLTNDEKALLINLVSTKKKYGLVWDDKPEDVEEILREYLPILKEDNSRAIQSSSIAPNHILIEGDNLHALTALTFTHEGKIDVIYIDPPYNTGARDWKYNNNYVDETDPYRHSKWLAMMSRRLVIAKKLLAREGIIMVTIDDYEMHHLWCLLEQIFGYENHLGTIAIRINPGGRKSKRKVAAQHEYAIIFAKSPETKIAKIVVHPDDKSHSYEQDADGTWYELRNLRKEGQDSLAKEDAKRYYPIYRNPETGQISTKEIFSQEIWPLDTKGVKRIWRRGKGDIDELFQLGNVLYKETKYGPQIYFKFRGGTEFETPKSFWDDKKYSASEHGTRILDNILNEREKFPFPKSLHAVKDCLLLGSDKKDAIILDFFAGSGTSLHATMELNKEDGGCRQCILVTNNENNICQDVTYERNKRVIVGYGEIEGIANNNLRYFQCDFIGRENTLKNKQLLTSMATALLRIKENCYTEIQEYCENKKAWGQLFGNSVDEYLLIILDESMVDEAVEIIKKVIKNNENAAIKVYIFSNGQYPYTEEFDEVIKHITLCALPDAIYNAYNSILPDLKRTDIPELEEPTAQETDQTLELEPFPILNLENTE